MPAKMLTKILDYSFIEYIIIIAVIGVFFAMALSVDLDRQSAINSKLVVSKVNGEINVAEHGVKFPAPVLCNADKEILHWSNNGWQCLPNPGIANPVYEFYYANPMS